MKTDDAYFASCEACEIHIVIYDAEARDSIKRKLIFDKRDQRGGNGRVLSASTEAMTSDGKKIQLQKGDRLGPSGSLPDVGALEKVDNFPLEVAFWRSDKQAMTHHRNPIFRKDMGIGMKLFAVDIMHCLHLGAVQVYLALAVWCILSSNAFGFRLALSAEARNQMGVNRTYSDICKFYTTCAWPITRINDLTLKMLGTKSKPKCKLKAAVSEGMLRFIVFLLRKLDRAVSRGRELLKAGEDLLRLLHLLNTCPLQPSREQVQAQRVRGKGGSGDSVRLLRNLFDFGSCLFSSSYRFVTLTVFEEACVSNMRNFGNCV